MLGMYSVRYSVEVLLIEILSAVSASVISFGDAAVDSQILFGGVHPQNASFLTNMLVVDVLNEGRG